MSELPWIVGGSERVRDTGRAASWRQIGYCYRACKKLCRMVLQGEESHKEKDLET